MSHYSLCRTEWGGWLALPLLKGSLSQMFKSVQFHCNMSVIGTNFAAFFTQNDACRVKIVAVGASFREFLKMILQLLPTLAVMSLTIATTFHPIHSEMSEKHHKTYTAILLKTMLAIKMSIWSKTAPSLANR